METLGSCHYIIFTLNPPPFFGEWVPPIHKTFLGLDGIINPKALLAAEVTGQLLCAGAQPDGGRVHLRAAGLTVQAGSPRVFWDFQCCFHFVVGFFPFIKKRSCLKYSWVK